MMTLGFANPPRYRYRYCLQWTARLLLFLCGLVFLASPAAAEKMREGDEVLITGSVTDSGGEFLAEVQVLLEISRSAFNLRRLGRQQSEKLILPTTTDSQGNYSIRWEWDPYYNTFELAVGVAVKEAAGEGFEIFHRQDISGQFRPGVVTEVPLTVADSEPLRQLRSFLNRLVSEDQKRIYREVGRPDRIDDAQEPGDETAWWYFALGKVYRFRDGSLVRLVPFEPIPPV